MFRLTCFHDSIIISSSPNKCVLRRGLLGTPQNADVTDSCLRGVSRNKLDTKSSLPEGLLLCIRHTQPGNQTCMYHKFKNHHGRANKHFYTIYLTVINTLCEHSFNNLRVSTVSCIGMKPTGRVSFISISFMSTRTLPKWLYKARNNE